MHIWVDADACPGVIREVLVKASQRTSIPLTFVANQHVPVPPNAHINSLRVSSGFDVADDEIVQRCEPNDLVITGDIPLAAEILEKGGQAVNFRGEAYDNATIKATLTMRDFMDQIRASGERTGGPKAFTAKDKMNFANQLDRIIAASR
ncbi:YaiI/YqxD family protein [Glaciecola sp. MH2013]|uniref:YaiI/YqxD family protein n=1 Tax=Glaciecola sp. MH2013 TaxID=2785524 RepID=UPI00189F7615|nr:YaiI/YqxD family protein [Glaciecola sp. MH2013]MBF7072760.1 YaiI/YqxD family protein [Glaciecola sp. MH2013]